MENKSNLLVLLLIVMMGTFSLVLIFKGDFKREIEIAKEEEEQKAERQIARKEKEEKFAIKWKPSEPKRAPAAAPAVAKQEVPRGPAITEQIYHANREPLVRTVTENEQGQRIIADEMVLAFKSGTTREEIEDLEKRYRLVLISYTPMIGLARFKTASGENLSRLKEQISKENTNIRYSEENYVAKLNPLPNDAQDAWFFENLTAERTFGVVKVKSTPNVDVGKGLFSKNVFNPPNPACALVAVVDSSFNTINHPDFGPFDSASAALTREPDSMGSPNPGEFNLLDRLTTAHRNQMKAKNAEISKILQNATDPLGLFEIIKNADADGRRTAAEQDAIDAKIAELNAKLTPHLGLHADLTHGIEVTSLIAAKQNNGIGTSGLCGSGPAVRAVMVARLNEDAQGNLTGVIIDSVTTTQGILHAVNQDTPARVINMSLVFDGPTTPNDCRLDSVNGGDNITRQVLSPCSIYDAVLQASLKGAVIVASAGNDAKDIKTEKPRAPATLSQAIRTVIAVGAVDPEGKIAAFSNTNNELVTLGAPGTFIKAPTQLTTAAGDAELDQMFGTIHIRTKRLINADAVGTFNQDMRKYSIHEFVDGTSSAAPLVAAVAGMLYKKIEGRQEFVGKPPSDIAATVKQLIMQNVQKIPDRLDKPELSLSRVFQTGGIVDAVAALAAADDPAKFNAALTSVPALEIGQAPAPAADSGSGIAQLFGGGDSGGGGGGCGFIDTRGSGPMPPWNNLPMILICVMPLFLWLRRRFVFGRIRKR